MDTLKYYKHLIANGETDEKAQAHVDALSGTLDNLVTKDYLHKELLHMKVLGWAMFIAVVVPSFRQFFEVVKLQ